MLTKKFQNTLNTLKMPQISKKEQVFVIFQKKKLHSSLSSISTMQRFNQTPLCKKTIQQNVTKYCLHGTHLDRNKFGR